MKLFHFIRASHAFERLAAMTAVAKGRSLFLSGRGRINRSPFCVQRKECMQRNALWADLADKQVMSAICKGTL
jgi:hypothetical protein